MDELTLDGKTYVSARRAAERTGYTKDYIGQLCRGGKLPSRMVGRNWYIEEGVLETQKKSTLQKQASQESMPHGLATKSEPNVSEVSAEEIAAPARHQTEEISDTPLSATPIKTEIPLSSTRTTPPTAEQPPRAVPPNTSAFTSLKFQSVADASALPRYKRHIVEEAFPMQYEKDERPLIPTPTRNPHTTIDVSSVESEQYQTEDVLSQYGSPQPSDPPAQITAHAPLSEGERSTLAPQISNYVADARAVRMQRYGPKPRPLKRQHDTPMRSSLRGNRENKISLKRDKHNLQHRKTAGAPIGIITAAVVALIGVGALVYGSFLVEEYRSYEKANDNSYELREKYVEFF